MRANIGITKGVFCACVALLFGTTDATVYTDAWTEGAEPSSSHNGYITYTYHSAGGIQTMTVNPPEDGDEFIFTGGKLSIMNSGSGSGNASISATKACKVVFQNDVYARNFTMTAPAAPAIVTNHFYRNLIGTDYVTVLENANLDDYEPIGIFQDYKDEANREIDSTSGQRWLNRAQTLFPHILVREAGKLSFQYQTGAADVKAAESKDGYKVSRVVKVEMRQVGADIKMRAVKAYSVYSDASNPLNHGFDVDVLWDIAEVEEQLLYTGGDDVGYGFNTVALKYIGPTFTMRFEGSSTTLNTPQPSARAKVEIAGGTTLNQLGYPDVRGGSIAILDRSHEDFRWYVSTYNSSQNGEVLFATTQPTTSPSVTNTLVYKLSNYAWKGKTPIAVKGIEGYPMLLDVQKPDFGLPSNSTVTVKYGGIVKLGGSNLTFSNGDKGGVKSGTCDFIVEKGGLLHQAANWLFGKNTEITLNGGTLLISSGDAASLSTDFRNLTLRNGALIDVTAARADKPMRIGQLGTGFTWNVGGDAPSTNNVLVQFCSYGANKVSTNTFNVAKTGDGSFDADLVFTRPIQMHGGTVTYTTNVLRKVGFGTMRLNGAYTVPGTVKIEGGAIKLGGSSLWGTDSNKTPIELCGGAIAAAANTSNGLGRVTLVADSELKLEESAILTLPDLSSVAWDADAMLDVTIPTDSAGNQLASVRFGATKGGLTDVQIAAIRVNGKKAMLDRNGWLQRRWLGTCISIR